MPKSGVKNNGDRITPIELAPLFQVGNGAVGPDTIGSLIQHFESQIAHVQGDRAATQNEGTRISPARPDSFERSANQDSNAFTAAAFDVLPPGIKPRHDSGFTSTSCGESSTQTLHDNLDVPDVPEPFPTDGATTRMKIAGNRLLGTTSKGTIGHPHSCAAACRYVKRKGGCHDGIECAQCHLCFWRRRDGLKTGEGNRSALTKTAMPSQMEAMTSVRQQKCAIGVNAPMQLHVPDLVCSSPHRHTGRIPSTDVDGDDSPYLEANTNCSVPTWSDTRSSKLSSIEAPKRLGVMKIVVRQRPASKQHENFPMGSYVPGSVFLSMMDV